MNIHSAIKFGAKNNIKVSPSHEATPDNSDNSTTKHKTEQVTPEADSKKTEQTPAKTTASQTTASQNINQPKPSEDKKPSDDKKRSDKPAAMPISQKTEVQPLFRAVDLSIAGTPHRITCPADEVTQLERAGAYINDKIRELRRAIKSKNPTNEELLVLVCLELYDQCQHLNSERELQSSENERAQILIEKIIKDARSVL